MTSLSSKSFTLYEYCGYRVGFTVEYTPDFELPDSPAGDPTISGVEVTTINNGHADGHGMQHELAQCIEDDLISGDLPNIFDQLR